VSLSDLPSAQQITAKHAGIKGELAKSRPGLKTNLSLRDGRCNNIERQNTCANWEKDGENDNLGARQN